MAVVATAAFLVAACTGNDESSAGRATTVPAASGASDTGRCTIAPDAPTKIEYQQVAGVDPNLLSLEAYGPASGCPALPVVFWVHGGGWFAGDMDNEGTATKAAWAAEHGWALVAVNYRLSTPGADVMWPVHGQDAATAVGYTLDHADELGIDPSSVAVMGHSAGGHIVSMLAVDPDLLAEVGHDRSDVDCFVSLDTEGYDLVERVGAGGDITDDMVANAFGTDPAAQAAASPRQTLEQVGGPVADALLVTRGLPRRKAQAAAFADALRTAGGTVTVVDAEGYTHGDVSLKLGTADDAVVTPPVTTFLESCLA